MYPDAPFDIVKLSGDEHGMHFGLYTGSQLVSVISLFNEDRVYQFRKFATLPHFQNNGYGTLLLQHVINYMTAQHAVRIWCNARITASPFYKRFGFTETAGIFSKDGIDYVIMELQL